jgi:hypothetical protein
LETSGDSAFRSSGSIRFAPASGNRGTLVTLELKFEPPGGPLGNAAAKILRIVPATMAFKALQRFKNLAETGEIATADDQFQGVLREGSWGRAAGCAGAKLFVFNISLHAAWVVQYRARSLGGNRPRRPRSRDRHARSPHIDASVRSARDFQRVGILSERRRDLWLWARVVGDAMDLALLGSALAPREGSAIVSV